MENAAAASAALAIDQYVLQAQVKGEGVDWLSLPEIPTAEELCRSSITMQEILASPNKAVWESKEDYLGSHYKFCREEATFALREAVGMIRVNPGADEAAFRDNASAIGIYEKTRVAGITFAGKQGIAVRLSFSTKRSGTLIDWEDSKRLIPGSLVVLSPDKFKKILIVGVVASFTIPTSDGVIPQVDLFLYSHGCLDPALEYVMVESEGFFEAQRYNMLALQKMMTESTPLLEILLGNQVTVGVPAFIEAKPQHNISEALNNAAYTSIDVCTDWTDLHSVSLDVTQRDALQRILSREIGLVQGPPGTGKTHVSVLALHTMLQNLDEGDPPIIIAAQTNHALDALLSRLVRLGHDYENCFIRLGGRTEDTGVIKQRSLFNAREAYGKSSSQELRNIRTKQRNIERDIRKLLQPLSAEQGPIGHELLQKLDIISNQQADSLVLYAAKWSSGVQESQKHQDEPIVMWLGNSLVVPNVHQPAPNDFGFDVPEEVAVADTGHIRSARHSQVETITGEHLELAHNFDVSGPEFSDKVADATLRKYTDLGKLDFKYRPALYRILMRRAKEHILAQYCSMALEYGRLAKEAQAASAKRDVAILLDQKIVGMTTTGFSKNRALISALNPRTVLIEEAGESIEAPVISTCVPSLQQLVLVGDHLQLRAHVQKRQHEHEHFDISMFERLVDNNVPFTRMEEQRRMTWEVRRLLFPIYGPDLRDHKSVHGPENRPAVPGMGDFNSQWVHHTSPESRDGRQAIRNDGEADYVVAFAHYIVQNGMDPAKITILTFYNGQKAAILKRLREHPGLISRPTTVDVRTVDSFQGEENEVILLSLVRNNEQGNIGFLKNDNRVCVALSRARCGLYIFGNVLTMIEGGSPVWNDVVRILLDEGPKDTRFSDRDEKEMRVHGCIRLRCSNHQAVTICYSAIDFRGLDGGCTRMCGAALPCGHKCPMHCHPSSHDNVRCKQCCGRILRCGHKCARSCQEMCICDDCDDNKGMSPALRHDEAISNSTSRSDSLESKPYTNVKWPKLGTSKMPKDVQQPPIMVTQAVQKLIDFDVDDEDEDVSTAPDTPLPVQERGSGEVVDLLTGQVTGLNLSEPAKVGNLLSGDFTEPVIDDAKSASPGNAAVGGRRRWAETFVMGESSNKASKNSKSSKGKQSGKSPKGSKKA